MISFKKYLKEQLEIGIELHDELNPLLWETNDKLKEDIKNKLLHISDKFIEYLSIDKQWVVDVIITGSNCSYTYTKFSDIDLHLVLKEDVICKDCPGDFIESCFQAKKTNWNDNHDIKIKGYDVELYAQSEKDNLVAAGIYSLQKNEWIKKPKKQDKTPNIDSHNVKLKTQEFITAIDEIIEHESDDLDNVTKLKDKIKRYRQSGLEKSGEISIENLTYKTLRNNGYLEKLNKYVKKIEDKKLSY